MSQKNIQPLPIDMRAVGRFIGSGAGKRCFIPGNKWEPVGTFVLHKPSETISRCGSKKKKERMENQSAGQSGVSLIIGPVSGAGEERESYDAPFG